MTAPAGRPDHLLVFEPRTEGHHLSWLKFITEDLLTTNLKLTLAVDTRPENQAKIRDHLGDLLSNVTIMNARGRSGNWRTGKADILAQCLRESGAANVFMGALDEIASDCWRRAAIGIFPPAELRGHVGGIYHRPRFLGFPRWSPKRWIKQIGFQRVLTQNWLRPLIFLDEYLTRDLQTSYPQAPISFLPVPCPETSLGDRDEARKQLGIPPDKTVFLFYGGGYRRKGLHLTVQAMLDLPENSSAFLLCAGRQNPEGDTARGLEKLAQQNRALLINRYITTAEEKSSFSASDVVLLPYIHHFGASGVLGQAVTARKMVIVSDEELLGCQTRDNNLGLLFTTNDSNSLRDRLQEATRLSPEQRATFAQACERYAKICSRESYRTALLNAIPHAR